MFQDVDCSVFQPAACPLIENNMVGYNNTIPDTAVCQESCGNNAACKFFTHYNTTCYHLASCDYLESCQDCISGPPSPHFSSCPWPPAPTTPVPATTTTKITTTTTNITRTTPTTTTTPATTTITSTTTPDESCNVFVNDEVCDMNDENIINTKHNITVGACQDLCLATSECTWFTWYHFSNYNFCWLLKSCDTFENCNGCVCGPATGADVDDCFATPTTPSPTPTPTVGPSTEFTTGPIASTTTESTTTPDACSVFSEAACDIDESNTLEVHHDLTVGMCQDTCSESSDCHFFTWYPSLGELGTCWLLDHCTGLQVCPYCVSGPAGDVDVDDCFSSNSTTASADTTTTAETGTSAQPTTMGDGCDMFTSEACDIDETNNLDIVHDLMVAMCQNMCRAHPDCHYFTWNNVYGLLGTCWLLDHCNSTEACPSCISGPANGVDVGSC